MSEVPKARFPRADAQRRRTAILEAAIAVLGRRPDASVEDVASAAGVTRQTVYAHFRSRDGLVGAVLDHATEETIAAVDGAALDDGPATDALLRFLGATWRVFERTPGLAHLAAQVADPVADDARHEPISERLERLIRRGQRSAEFDRRLPVGWLVNATVALGHAAGEEVASGRMDARSAERTLRRSVLRLYGTPQP